MIALDTQLLVYAHREDSPHHATALRALHRLVDGRSPWAIPWPCLHEFIAIITHPRIYRPPTPMKVAVEALRGLLELPHVHALTEAADHGTVLGDLLLDSPGTAGPRVHDARVAAICLSHGVRELWSADRDFSWFPALRVVNPLVG